MSWSVACSFLYLATQLPTSLGHKVVGLGHLCDGVVLHRTLHARPVSSSSSEYFAAGMVSTHVYSREENLPKSDKHQALHIQVGDVSGAAQAAAPEWTPPRRGARGRGPSASSP